MKLVTLLQELLAEAGLRERISLSVSALGQIKPNGDYYGRYEISSNHEREQQIF